MGYTVAPLAGAWIEIYLFLKPMTERKVAPLAGAWIEISIKNESLKNDDVAPLAGAWIEIMTEGGFDCSGASLLSRERGLKYITCGQTYQCNVAPLAGAWIEI